MDYDCRSEYVHKTKRRQSHRGKIQTVKGTVAGFLRHVRLNRHTMHIQTAYRMKTNCMMADGRTHGISHKLSPSQNEDFKGKLQGLGIIYL